MWQECAVKQMNVMTTSAIASISSNWVSRARKREHIGGAVIGQDRDLHRFRQAFGKLGQHLAILCPLSQ
ncbi:hypothetical protein KCP73_22335 [Salmonella enterica subsp. enterica]|nr:hypothetical protein KCP73_22335 [Salmonella enterica subsp. enterica]